MPSTLLSNLTAFDLQQLLLKFSDVLVHHRPIEDRKRLGRSELDEHRRIEGDEVGLGSDLLSEPLGLLRIYGQMLSLLFAPLQTGAESTRQQAAIAGPWSQSCVGSVSYVAGLHLPRRILLDLFFHFLLDEIIDPSASGSGCCEGGHIGAANQYWYSARG